MALGEGILPDRQSHHIELTAGNLFAVGLMSLLFYGVANWTTNYLARTNIPVVSHLSVGAQYYLHGVG
jgi:hypothetical protein